METPYFLLDGQLPVFHSLDPADFLRQAPFDLLSKPVHGFDRQPIHPRDFAGRVAGESAFKIKPFSRGETGQCRLQGRERLFQQQPFLPLHQLVFGRCRRKILGASRRARLFGGGDVDHLRRCAPFGLVAHRYRPPHARHRGRNLGQIRGTVAARQPPDQKRRIGRKLLPVKQTKHRLIQFRQALHGCGQATARDDRPNMVDRKICALLYNQGRMQEVVPACDKAIAADPAKADAYFIKGSALFGDARIENGKMVLPDGAVQALQKYLELAPSGSHVTDVKAMLTSVGQTIETTYQNRKRN